MPSAANPADQPSSVYGVRAGNLLKQPLPKSDVFLPGPKQKKAWKSVRVLLVALPSEVSGQLLT